MSTIFFAIYVENNESIGLELVGIIIIFGVNSISITLLVGNLFKIYITRLKVLQESIKVYVKQIISRNSLEISFNPNNNISYNL